MLGSVELSWYFNKIITALDKITKNKVHSIHLFHTFIFKLPSTYKANHFLNSYIGKNGVKETFSTQFLWAGIKTSAPDWKTSTRMKIWTQNKTNARKIPTLVHKWQTKYGKKRTHQTIWMTTWSKIFITSSKKKEKSKMTTRKSS